MTASNAPVVASRLRPTGFPAWCYRVAAGLAALSLFFQSVTAGQFISDKSNHVAFAIHRTNAMVAAVLVILMIVAAILVRVRDHGSAGPIWRSIGLFVLVGVEIIAGFAKLTPLHIPLAVAIIALSVWIAVTSWLPSRRTASLQG